MPFERTSLRLEKRKLVGYGYFVQDQTGDNECKVGCNKYVNNGTERVWPQLHALWNKQAQADYARQDQAWKRGAAAMAAKASSEGMRPFK